MSRKKILWLLVVSLLAIGIPLFCGLKALADRGHLTACTSTGSPNDTTYFPYKFICGSDNDVINPRKTLISADVPGTDDPSNPATINSGQKINFTGGYNTSGTSGTGIPRYKDSSGVFHTSNEILVWATIDGNNALLGGTITTAQASTSIINVTDSTGGDTGKIAQCPGDHSGPWNGSSYNRGMYSVVYNHRDTAGGSGGSAGPNQSPAAWDGSRGKEDCGNEGKMVYWRHASQGTGYKFSVDLPPGVEGDLCVRYNISYRFEDTTENTPLFSPDDAFNNDSSNDQNSVASHVVQQSYRECYRTVNLPSPVSNGSCNVWQRSPLQPTKTYTVYRFSYFSKDEPHVTGTPAATVTNPTSWTWQSFNSTPEAQQEITSTTAETSGNIVYSTGPGAQPGTITYGFPAATGPDRLLYVESWTNTGSGTYAYDGGEASHYSSRTTVNGPCYAGACSITVDPAIVANPSSVVAGQQISASVTLQNEGFDILKTPLPSGLLGVVIDFNGGKIFGQAPYKLNSTISGSPPYTVTIPVTITAPASAGSYALSGYPAYFNPPSTDGFRLVGSRNGGAGQPYGTACTSNLASISSKVPFVLTPHAVQTKLGTDESPGTITYNTSVENKPVSGGVTVSAAQTSTFTLSGGNIVPSNTASGPFSPGNNPPTSYLLNGTHTPPTVTAGDEYCTEIKLTDFNIGAVAAGGTIVDKQLVDDVDEGYKTSDKTCFTVVNEPYVRAYTSGVSAGGNFESTGCANPAGKGNLGAWSHTPTYFGSGANYSALAMADITGFISGYGQGLTLPSGVTNDSVPLSFANQGVTITSSVDSPKLGGNFGGNHCIKQVKQPPANPVPTAGPSRVRPLASIPSGKYTYTGDIEIFNGNIPTLKNIELHVNGDVYISDSITYAGGGTPGNATSFTLRTTGNIYIDPGVRELDGYYIAEGNGTTTGKIYTCADTVGPTRFAPMSPSNMFAGCTEQLTIYGAFAANQVNLMRTYGSLRNSPNPGAGCTHSGSGPASGPTCAAEAFRFTPELYLAAPPDGVSKSWGSFDQITSLPPVL